MNVPINEILEKVGGALAKASDKIQPIVHSGKVQDFWNWVDAKWYRSDLHNGVKDPRNIK